MLIKFVFQDFLDDRRFKNTIKVNIRNYQTLLGEFVDYCIQNGVVIGSYSQHGLYNLPNIPTESFN